MCGLLRFNCILVYCHTLQQPAPCQKLLHFNKECKFLVVWRRNKDNRRNKNPKFAPSIVLIPFYTDVCVFFYFSYAPQYCSPLLPAAAAERRGLASLPEAAFLPASTGNWLRQLCPERSSISPSVLHQTGS